MKHFRSSYSLSRYFTPPKPVPLYLDLARLEGGGSAPAQFYGETHDGRDVYIRYRGGNFSITLENEAGVEGETRIVDTAIGPPLDGLISLEQVCNYFGITINGVCPPLPAPGDTSSEQGRDLSGATTFYSAWLSSTLDTQRRFLASLLAAFPGATLIEPILDDQFRTVGHRACPTVESLTRDDARMILGGLTAEAITKLTQEPLWDYQTGDCMIQFVTCGFQYPITKYGNGDAENMLRATGKTILVAGQVDDCLYGSFSVHSEFRTEDANRQGILQKFDQLLDEFFPAYRVEYFDLLTGRKEPEESFIMHFDPEIAGWLDAGADRWFSIANKGDWKNPRFVGSRLVRLA